MSGLEAFGWGVLGAIVVLLVLAILHDLIVAGTKWRG